MPWQVVEKHEGRKTMMRPAIADGFPAYFTKFEAKQLRRTPFRPTQQQASAEGLMVFNQVQARREWLEATAAGRRAAVPNPHGIPSSNNALVRAPYLAAVLPSVTGAPEGPLAQHQNPPAAHGSAPGTVPRFEFVELGMCYHGGLPGSTVQLGGVLGSGGYGDVHLGTVVHIDGLHFSDAQQYQKIVAAAAKQFRGSPVAVKVFRSSSSGKAANTLQQQLEALSHLRFFPGAVQLFAEGWPVSAPASSPPTAVCAPASSSPATAGSSCSQPSSSTCKRKAPACDPSAVQLPYCAVLERCQCSLHDVIVSKGRLSKSDTWFITGQLVHFLDYCQNGQLGCIIVHRDLKPANILLRLDDSIAVSDFGVCHIIKLSAAGEGSAQQVEEQQQLPNAPAAAWPGPAAVAAAAAAPLYTNIGTPFYAAPDVYGTGAAAASSGGSDGGDSSSSSKRSYDASVDVFALGVVVVEMLLGSLAGVCGSGAPRSVAQAEQWEQRLGMLVDGELQLPEGVVVSAAARQFISCCCGGGKERVAAAARGEAKRLTPAQLKQTAWMQQQQ